MSLQDIRAKKDRAYLDLDSPNGKIIMDDLIMMFSPDKITGKTKYETEVKAHQSDVIRYIQRRIKDGMEGKSF
jgi:hypothetical protein